MKRTNVLSSVVLTVTVLLSAACQSAVKGTQPIVLPPPGVSATATATTATATSPASPGAAKALTADFLRSALVSGTDVPGYTAKPDTPLPTGQARITVGGPACQKFIDAYDAVGAGTGATTSVLEALLANGTSQPSPVVSVALHAYPSPDKARSAISGFQQTIAGCKSLTAQDAGSTSSMTLSSLPALGLGDNSADLAGTLSIAGKNLTLRFGVVQVGPTTVVVEVVTPTTKDQAKLSALTVQLKTIASKQVTKLKAALKS